MWRTTPMGNGGFFITKALVATSKVGANSGCGWGWGDI